MTNLFSSDGAEAGQVLHPLPGGGGGGGAAPPPGPGGGHAHPRTPGRAGAGGRRVVRPPLTTPTDGHRRTSQDVQHYVVLQT